MFISEILGRSQSSRKWCNFHRCLFDRRQDGIEIASAAGKKNNNGVTPDTILTHTSRNDRSCAVAQRPLGRLMSDFSAE